MSRMRILTTGGVTDVELAASRTRSVVGNHWDAIQAFLYTGETEQLEPYRRLRVAGHQLLTDPDEIERLARLGELDVDGIYEDPQ
jgi:hypothetical protein